MALKNEDCTEAKRRMQDDRYEYNSERFFV